VRLWLLHHDTTHFCKAAIQASSCLNALGTQSLNQGTPLCHQPGRAMVIIRQQQPNAIMKWEKKSWNELSQHRVYVGGGTAEKSARCWFEIDFCWFCHWFFSLSFCSAEAGGNGLQFLQTANILQLMSLVSAIAEAIKGSAWKRQRVSHPWAGAYYPGSAPTVEAAVQNADKWAKLL